jgi:uroporphyrinogen-III decarboxylase
MTSRERMAAAMRRGRPVTVLEGTPAACFEDARRRIEVAKGGGGYVLSTACSVPPGAPPENVERLAAAAEAFGAYD